MLLRAGLFVLVIVCMLSLNSQTPALGMAPTQPADIPVTVVSEYFNEWTLNSGLLYWAGRCTGGEQRWSANLKRMPTYASIAGMIATVDSNHCLTYMQMAADSQGVYYYDEDGGNRIQSRSSATPYTETTVFNLPVGMYPVGERLAVDGDYVYWLTNGGQLVRVRKDNADFGIVASGLSSPKDLVVVGNIAYWLEATGLWRADVNCAMFHPGRKSSIRKTILPFDVESRIAQAALGTMTNSSSGRGL